MSGAVPPLVWSAALSGGCPACGKVSSSQAILLFLSNVIAVAWTLAARTLRIALCFHHLSGRCNRRRLDLVCRQSALNSLVWLHLASWPPFVTVLVRGLLRPAKALMIAAQHKHRHQDFENGVS